MFSITGIDARDEMLVRIVDDQSAKVCDQSISLGSEFGKRLVLTAKQIARRLTPVFFRFDATKIILLVD